MLSRKQRVLIYVPLVAAALFAVFIVGVHVGYQQFLLMDSSAQAVLLTNELKVIRAGNAEKLIEGKEIDLDGKIVRALEFQESGHPWLFYPFAWSYDHDSYLHTVALYRKSYPPVTPKISGFGGDEEHQNEMKNYQTEVTNRTRLLIEQYGK